MRHAARRGRRRCSACCRCIGWTGGCCRSAPAPPTSPTRCSPRRRRPTPPRPCSRTALRDADRCELTELPPGADLLAAAAPSGWVAEDGTASPCPVLVLGRSLEASVPARQRRKLRMARHRADRAGPWHGGSGCRPRPGLPPSLACTARAGQARGQPDGVLADPRMAAFLAEAVPRAGRIGRGVRPCAAPGRRVRRRGPRAARAGTMAALSRRVRSRAPFRKPRHAADRASDRAGDRGGCARDRFPARRRGLQIRLGSARTDATRRAACGRA